MYVRWLDFLKNKKIILASGSIQRINLLKEMGLNFQSQPSEFPENLEKTTAKDYVSQTSLKKFEEFLKNNTNSKFDILITADTIVEHEGKILEKPKDENEIYEWLLSYSNGRVVCYTSVVIGIVNKKIISEGIFENEVVNSVQFTNLTDIYFDEITKDMITDYIATGEPFNRAGGFAIQGIGRFFIKKIDGCYYNVVGFPIQEFAKYFTNLLENTYGEVIHKN